jgi:hypothetical protein
MHESLPFQDTKLAPYAGVFVSGSRFKLLYIPAKLPNSKIQNTTFKLGCIAQ